MLGRVSRSSMPHGEEAQDWGKAGRIGIYTANFGDVGTTGSASGAGTALADLSCVAVCVQEVSPAIIDCFRKRGRHLSDLRFARTRQEGGDGLLVASNQNLVAELITHAEVSGPVGVAGALSAQLFVTARFAAGLAGRGDVTVGNFHLHRETAKRGIGSVEFQQWARQLGRAIMITGTRVLVGDANMGLYVVGEALAQYGGGVLAQLVAHHRELTPCTALAGMDDRGLLRNVHHDSCGIWIVGGVHTVKSLSLGSRCIWGAMHPALLHESRQGGFKVLTRGYKYDSYKMPPENSELFRRMRDVPDAETLTKVLALWGEHKMDPLSAPKTWSWSLDVETLTAQAWVSVANCLPKTGEAMEVVGSPAFGLGVDRCSLQRPSILSFNGPSSLNSVPCRGRVGYRRACESRGVLKAHLGFRVHAPRWRACFPSAQLHRFLMAPMDSTSAVFGLA